MTYRFHSLVMAALFALAASCSPELRGRSCTSDADCLPSETCDEGRGLCVERNAVDAVEPVDAVDAADGTDVETVDGPSDAEDLDAEDLHPEVIDTDDQQGDPGDTDDDDPDEEDSDPTCPSASVFNHSIALKLYEPCGRVAPAYLSDTCHSRVLANPGGTSSWIRANEPVEVPLANGILDASVAMYLPLDGNLNDPRGGAPVSGPTTPDFAEGFSGSATGALALSSGEHLEMLEPNLLSGVSEWSVLFYFNPSDAPGEEDTWTLVHRQFESTLDASISIQVASIGLSFEIKLDSNNQAEGRLWDYLPVIDDWIHIALVQPFGGSPIAYLDGEPIATSWQTTETYGGPLLSASSWTFGTGPAPLQDFPGRLDELLVLERALTPTEVAAYYNSHRPFASHIGGDTPPEPDFDDVRLTGRYDGDSSETQIPFEIIGVRPRSDRNLTDVVGYWPLDGEALSEVTGIHTPVDHGTTTTVGRFGDASGARAFNSDSESYIDTDFAQALLPNEPFTIEVWARGGDGVVYGLQDIGGVGHLRLCLNCADIGDEVRVSISDTSGTAAILYLSSVDPDDGQWHHYALVRRDAPDSDFVLFIDGVLVDRVNDNLAGSAINPSGAPLYLGHTSGLIGKFFDGDIDEFIIHGRALGAEEIRRRSQPRLPTLRFLASTRTTEEQPDRYPYQSYRLYWGNSNVSYSEPLVENAAGSPCLGLLSPCNGYVGWWRFNEGFVQFRWRMGANYQPLIDASTSNQHANSQPQDAPVWAPGIEGTSMVFGSGASVGPLSLDLDTGLTVEVTALRAREGLAEPERMVTLSEDADCEPTRLSLIDDRSTTHLAFSFDKEDGELCEVGPAFSASLTLDPTQWHVYGTAHQFGTTSESQLFLDGEQTSDRGTWTGGNGSELTIDDPSWLYFGDYLDLPDTDEPFQGRLDSIRVMNVPLDETEILHYPLTRVQMSGVEVGGCVLEP